ncbi:MAG TPA: BatA domain-containing protein, partial [Gemmatimonadales bacterium]
MTLLNPAWLIAAGAAALGVMLLHLIVTREPDVAELPTARFAPDQVIEARTRRLTPRDLPLMLLRVAIVLTAGLALAHPVLRPPRRALGRVVVVDRSRAVADPREAAGSAASLLRAGDLLLLFDSVAGAPLEDGPDSLAGLVTSSAAGRLSPALIAALRAASTLSDRVDSIGLVLVSPLVAEEFDAATDSIRRLWPGGIRVIRIAAARDSTGSRRMSFEGGPDDQLRLALPAEFVESGS